MGIRAAIYLRVSTQDQSCDMQLREVIKFIESKGWLVVGTYEDKATGTNANRPMLKALLTDARDKKFDVIVCWKLDRLFRSIKDLILTLQDLTELGIDFVSLRDNIDLTSASGRLMVHMLGAFAEFEASLIRSRVRAGLDHARSIGTKLGRPIKVNQTRMVELRKAGLSMSEIAHSLGIAKSTVSKTLHKVALSEGFQN